jgi:hypothetical protein
MGVISSKKETSSLLLHFGTILTELEKI